MMTTRFAEAWCALAVELLLWSGAVPAAPAAAPATYHNPLPVRLADGALAQNCADPAVLRDPAAATPTWYMYCTMDPVSHAERDGDGWRFHMIPIYRSTDLVHWDYVRDAFATRPAVAAPKAGLWAPEPEYFNGRYYLYFTVTDVADAAGGAAGCDNDSGIAVATSTSPVGPWETAPAPVVVPRHDASSKACSFHWTFDPKVIGTADGARYIYYGSYGGGIFVQRLSSDGLRVEGTATMVGAANRYEGADVVRHEGAYYLFASATDCCNGPLTGYALFVGRAERPEGPFLDRHGNDMAGYRAGGELFLTQNGNRWVGSGHNTVFEDAAGQWWTIYHAIDRNDPYFSVKDKLTRRLAMLDRIDWIDGWPVAARGQGPSDATLPAPSATSAQSAPGVAATAAATSASTDAHPAARAEGTPARAHPRAAQGSTILGDSGGRSAALLWSDRFRGTALDARWQWVRPRGEGGWATGADGLVLPTEKADLHQDTNNASLLTTALPRTGDVRIEARLKLDAPDGCCADPVQAGLVVLKDDDHYVKLVELAHDGLRQVEFAKETTPAKPGYPRYGNTVVGTPGTWTWLRLDIQRNGREERYTAWSSQNGTDWIKGGTWTHQLGHNARLALAAMGGTGHHATFDSITVSRLASVNKTHAHKNSPNKNSPNKNSPNKNK